MSNDIPEWAWDRVNDLAIIEAKQKGYHLGPLERDLSEAFARYIAEHEDPPVDPLLIEAREMAAGFAQEEGWPCDEKDFLAGNRDTTNAVQWVLAALKRGIEIGKAEQ